MNQPMIRPQLEAQDLDNELNGEETVENERPVPSWFPRPVTGDTDELVNRYRVHASRPLRDDGPQAQRPRPVMPKSETVARQRYYREFPHQADETEIRTRQRSMGGVYAMAGLLAIIAGGATGMAFANLDKIVARTQEFAASLQSQPAAAVTEVASAGGQTTVPKKLVATATLDVADVSGGLNSFIPLMLHAEPALGGDAIALKVSGLPKDAYLTAGSKSPDETWLLKPEEAAEVKLVVPRAEKQNYDVSVAAIEAGTGELAAPIKEIKLAINDPSLQITPASAEPEQKTGVLAVSRPVEQQPVPDAAADLLKKGDLLLASGDMAAARQFYERAFTLGSSAGALGVGKTYDPTVYLAQNVQGLAPDPVRAMEWYMRAANSGHQDALMAIETLKTAAR